MLLSRGTIVYKYFLVAFPEIPKNVYLINDYNKQYQTYKYFRNIAKEENVKAVC